MERKSTYIRAWRNKRGYSLDDMVGRLAEIGAAKIYDFLPHLNKEEIEQAEKVLKAMFGDRQT